MNPNLKEKKGLDRASKLILPKIPEIHENQISILKVLKSNDISSLDGMSSYKSFDKFLRNEYIKDESKKDLMDLLNKNLFKNSINIKKEDYEKSICTIFYNELFNFDNKIKNSYETECDNLIINLEEKFDSTK